MRTDWTDMEMLSALDLRDHEGLNGTEIARRLGRSRNAVCGMFHRVDRETNEADVTPELNGTMPRKWWRRNSRVAERRVAQ